MSNKIEFKTNTKDLMLEHLKECKEANEHD